MSRSSKRRPSSEHFSYNKRLSTRQLKDTICSTPRGGDVATNSAIISLVMIATVASVKALAEKSRGCPESAYQLSPKNCPGRISCTQTVPEPDGQLTFTTPLTRKLTKSAVSSGLKIPCPLLQRASCALRAS